MTNGLPRRSTLWPEESTSYADESCFYSGDVHQEKKKKRKKGKGNSSFSRWDTRERIWEIFPFPSYSLKFFSYIYRNL